MIGQNLWTLWNDNNEYSIEYGSLIEQETVIGLEYTDLKSRIPVYTLGQNLSFPFPNEVHLTDDNEKYLLEKLVDPLYFTTEVLQLLFQEDNKLLLKDQIINEVQSLFSKKKELEMEENEVDHLIVECWKEIWRKCTQKWVQKHSPLGFAKYNKDTIGVISLSSISLIRPCEPLETLYLFPQDYKQLFLQFLDTNLDQETIQTMVTISEHVKNLSSFLNRELNEFEMNVFYNDDPFIEFLAPVRQFIYGLDSFVSEKRRKFLLNFQKEFEKIKDPLKCIRLIIALQEKMILIQQDHEMDEVLPFKYFNLKNLMSNITGQVIENRFRFSRDFSIYCYVLNSIYSLKMTFLPRIDQNLKMSYVQYWLSKQLTCNSENEKTFLNLYHQFLNSMNVYSNELLKITSQDQSPYLLSISHLLLYSSLNTIQSLWLLIDDKTKSIKLAQMLYEKGEFEILEEFSRLLLSEIPLFNYYLGICSLKKFKLEKAKDYFYKTAFKLTSPELEKEVLEIFGIFSKENLTYFYFEHLRKVCEKFPSLILEFSKSALEETKEEENQSRLLTSIFTIYLDFEDFDQAYHSLSINPDHKKRNLDLNRFLLTLNEKGLIFKINSYPFRGMITEVDEFLYIKAKSNRVTASPHLFEVLHSFHFQKGLFMKAAFYMFEFALKIEIESNDTKLLYKKRDCLLSCLNTFDMVETKNQWFLIKQDVQKIIYKKDVEKEYWINEARIKLSSRIMIQYNDPKELIILLVQNGYYDLSFSLANIYEMDKSFIFESMTRSCLEHQILEKPFLIHLEDSMIFNKKEKDFPWKMIEYYLKKYNKVDHQKVVIETILSLNNKLNLPLWLRDSFFKSDSATLFRIYIKFNKIQEAKEVYKKIQKEQKNQHVSDFFINVLRELKN